MKKIILMYHRVQDKAESNINNFSNIYKKKQTLVSTEIVKSDVEFLENLGWSHVSLGKFIKSREKVFHLSFDDGYIEHLTIISPLLQNLNIRNASFCINTCILYDRMVPLPLDVIYFSISHNGLETTLKRLNLPNKLSLLNSMKAMKSLTNRMTPIEIKRLPEDLKITSSEITIIRKQYLKPQDIVKLNEQGFTICSHGVTHRNLCKHRNISFSELKNSKKYLTKLIKKPVNVFSFPDGQYDKTLIKQCNKAGYEIMLAIQNNNEVNVLPRTFATSNGLWRKAVSKKSRQSVHKNSNWRIKNNFVKCDNYSFILSSTLTKDPIFEGLLIEYINKKAPPIVTVWMSQLLIELSISKTLRQLLIWAVNKDFAERFVATNYRIHYTTGLLTTFFFKANILKKRLNKGRKYYFKSRDTLDANFKNLTKGILVTKSLNKILSTWEGFSNRDFDKEFLYYKKLRHQFRRGQYKLKISSQHARLLTFDYLSRLSCATEKTFSELSLLC